MSSAVVIGGGVSGIVAALLLRRNGRSVTLLEKGPRLAPTLRGFYRKGLYFDTGLHLSGGLGTGGPLCAFFRLLEIDLPPLLPFDPQAYMRLCFGESGRQVDLPVGREAFAGVLAGQFPGEEDAIRAYVNDSLAVWDSSPFLNRARGADAAFTPTADTRSLSVYLAALTANAELRTSLSAHCLLYGSAPEETAFAQHALVAASCFDSVHNFAGGGAALIDALEAALARWGVRVLAGCGARAVTLSSAGNIAGVLTDAEETLPADEIVFTAHPSLLCDLVPAGALKSSYLRRLKELQDTPSACLLFGVAAEPVADLRGCNVILCPETDLSPAFSSGRAAPSGPFYVAECPQSTPDGRQAFVIIAPDSLSRWEARAKSSSRRRPADYAEQKATTLEAMRRAAAEFFPPLERMEIVDGATPLTLRDYMHAPTGALYGCRHSLTQFNPQPVTRLPGLWIAGQSVIAPGLLGAVLSAFLTSGIMTDLKELLRELRETGDA